MKPIRISLILLVIFYTILSINKPVSANQTFNPQNVLYEYEFGDSLTISASISQSDSIKNLTIVIEPENQQSRQIPTTIDNNHNLKSTYDLKTNSINPFSRVYFWFEAELTDGSILTSPSYWFDYIDNRLDWKNNSTSLFEIYWVNGDAAYGQELQQIARSGLERATQLIPVVPETPIEIYLYPDESELMTVLPVNAQSWVNGHTYLNSNRIIVADTPPLDNITDLEQTIPHEIMHLLQFQIMGTNYGLAPVWLTEGLATQTELYANTDLKRILDRAIADGGFRPISDLCLGVSKDSSLVLIDYAQSSSIVDFIQRTYGNEVFQKMLQNAANGMDCEKIVSTTLGLSLRQLETIWRDSLTGDKQNLNPKLISTILWISIPTLLIIAGVVALLIRRKKSSPDQEP